MRKLVLLLVLVLVSGCYKAPTVNNQQFEYRVFGTRKGEIPYIENITLSKNVIEKLDAIEGTEIYPTYMIRGTFLEYHSKSLADELGSVALYKNNEKIYEEIKGEKQSFINTVGYTDETLVKGKVDYKYTGDSSYNLEGYITYSVASQLGLNALNKDFNDEYVIKISTYIPVKNYDIKDDELTKTLDDSNYLFQPVEFEILVKGILKNENIDEHTHTQAFSMGEVFVPNDQLLKLIEENQLEELNPVTYLLKTTNPNIEEEIKKVSPTIHFEKIPWD